MCSSTNKQRRVVVRVVSMCIGVLSLAAPTPAQEARAQQAAPKRVEISADRAAGSDVQGSSVRNLTGNVWLAQEQTRLRAERAVQYPSRREIEFFGNVVIFERGDTLFADRVLYRERTKVGFAYGNVRLTDGEVVVTAPSAVYFTNEKRTTFEEGVTLVDSSSVLTSRTGSYWSDEKRAEFAGDVRLTSDDTVVWADSVSYEREAERSLARGNVRVRRTRAEQDSSGVETQTVTTIAGGWAYNDRPAELRRMRDDVVLVRVRSDSSSSDTLLIRADALHSVEKDTIDLMAATGDVQVWNSDTAARADSVHYTSILDAGVRRELIGFFERPIAWVRRSQITGDTLLISGHAGSVDTLRVRNRTFLADMDSVLNRINQVRGRDLVGVFYDNGRRRMTVGPNAEAIYYRQEDGSPNGAVQASADHIVFDFQDDDIERVSVLSGVEGLYYPEEKIPPDFQLEGFRWDPTGKPHLRVLLADPRLHLELYQPTDRQQQDEFELRKPPPDIEVVPPVAAVPDVPPNPPRAEIGRAEGRYTIVVKSTPSIRVARSFAADLEVKMSNSGYPVRLLNATIRERVYFRVCVGQFQTERAARRALSRLRGQLPDDSWILTLSGLK